MRQPATFTPHGSVRAVSPKGHVAPVQGTPAMFDAAQELSTATGAMSCCSGASPGGETVQPEGPHWKQYSTYVHCPQCSGASRREARRTACAQARRLAAGSQRSRPGSEHRNRLAPPRGGASPSPRQTPPCDSTSHSICERPVQRDAPPHGALTPRPSYGTPAYVTERHIGWCSEPTPCDG